MRDEMEQNEIAGLLRTLPRVEAPKDFDFKVKARIASGRPASRGIPVWVKAAVPLALVIAIGGYFGYRSLNAPSQSDATASQQTVPVAQPVVEQPSTPQNEVVASAPKPANTTLAGTKRAESRRQPEGGSLDSAVTIGKELDLRDRPVGDVFAEAGIKGSVDASGLKIESSDARSGLKAGDVVESIDGMRVSETMTTKGKLAGKKLRIRRDGKIVDVVVKD